MVDGSAQGRALYDKLARVCDRFLGITPSYFGHVPYDEYLRQAIRRQTTVVEAFPSSPSARAFQRLAQAVAAWTPASGARGGIEFFMERMLRAPGAFAAESAAR